MNSYGVFRGVMGLEGHIMSNFSFLLGQDDYEQFAIPCVEAEKAFSISPTMCAMATRKAFELAVKWVYAADRSIQMPYRDNLQSLIHEPTFERAIGNQKMLDSFQYIVKAGNITVHGKTRISPKDAMFDLKLLFVFIQWIDYSYGNGTKSASSIRNKCRASNKRSPVRKSKPKKTPRNRNSPRN